MKNYRVIFEVKGSKNLTSELRSVMEGELVRVYNIYVDAINGGITNKLNDEFEDLYPTYFKDNEDKDWYELVEYNGYITDGYQRLVVDFFNNENISDILEFYVDSEEIVFTGRLKSDKNVTISFRLKEV